jgi:hypothetical protein
LMALESDITVVAFVRNYERACEVLYDELLMEWNAKGPKPQLVEQILFQRVLLRDMFLLLTRTTRNMLCRHLDFIKTAWKITTFNPQ